MTLTVERNWQSSYNQTTILRNVNGGIVKIITSINQQPKKGLKSLFVGLVEYKLDWNGV